MRAAFVVVVLGVLSASAAAEPRNQLAITIGAHQEADLEENATSTFLAPRRAHMAARYTRGASIVFTTGLTIPIPGTDDNLSIRDQIFIIDIGAGIRRTRDRFELIATGGLTGFLASNGDGGFPDPIPGLFVAARGTRWVTGGWGLTAAIIGRIWWGGLAYRDYENRFTPAIDAGVVGRF